jgi:hypothetical protein
VVLDLESGDIQRALAVARELASRLWQRKERNVPLEEWEEAFRRLLLRRGYFVSTPADLASSLDEIRTLGEGFDLYELARQLAALDTIRTDCLKLVRRPAFPELRTFAPPCPCGHHFRKES